MLTQAICSPCDAIEKMADFQDDNQKLQIFAYLHWSVATLSITNSLMVLLYLPRKNIHVSGFDQGSAHWNWVRHRPTRRTSRWHLYLLIEGAHKCMPNSLPDSVLFRSNTRDRCHFNWSGLRPLHVFCCSQKHLSVLKLFLRGTYV